MMTSRSRPRSHEASYRELTPDRCAELLRRHTVGRVAWAAADGPQLFPVSYAWLDGQIVFQTSPYGVLSELVRRTEVVFEVDDLDAARLTGWSVIVHGISGAAALDDLGRVPSSPAGEVSRADGLRSVVIGIVPRGITGRSLLRAVT